MKLNLTLKIALFIIGSLILFFITNPSHQKHKEKLSQKYSELNPLTGMLGAGDFAGELTSYKDCYIYSYTNFITDIDNNKTMVSFGVLGMVFITTDIEIK